METKYTKKDYSTLVVEEVIPEKVIPETTKPTVEYSYDFLKKQVVDIQKQWDDQVARKNKEIAEINIARQKELDFVNEMISKCEALGITARPVEAQPTEEVIL